VSGKDVAIGAGTTHAEVAAHEELAKVCHSICHLAAHIGDPHVRHMGTIGGSVANNDPAADYPAAVLALGATIITSKRQIAADNFFDGLFTTALGEDEIITALSFPLGAKFGYAKFANPASRYALVGVAVAQRGSEVRVAVTGAGSDGVFRVPAMEAALAKSFAPDAVGGVKVDASGLMSDIHADAAYRANLVSVMAKRAVMAAA
jgi:carbon-monoxide dehydrogenase medium subunit